METTPPDRETSIGMDSRVQKKTGRASCAGAHTSKYGFQGKESMLEVRCGARGLSYRAGNPGRAAPKVPLGEARQEERDEWQRSSHGQGREIPGAISGPSFLNVIIRAINNWSNLVAVTDWGGANSRFLGLVSGGSTIIRSNGIQTVCHQKNPSN